MKLNQRRLDESRQDDPAGLARYGAALAHPHRVRLLRLLAAGPLTPTAIARALGLAPNLVAHHLCVLRTLGWVVVEPGDGDQRTVRYRLMSERLLSSITDLLATTDAKASASNEPGSSLLAPWAAAGDPAFVVDHEYRIRLWNNAAERYLGYQPQHVVGKLCTEIIQGC